MRYKVPTNEELEKEMPQKTLFHKRLLQYIKTKWNVTKDDVLENDLPKKNSAYYMLEKLPV